MPLPFLAAVAEHGVDAIPYLRPFLRMIPIIGLIALIKWYTTGATCKVDRLMKSKVVILTGGTSGIGASVARSLAVKGASLILLTSQPPCDAFIVDYIEDLRRVSNNELIYAEHVDLNSLHSIRQFATKWIDNAPPRRLDMVILCAATMVPRFSSGLARTTRDGCEPCWGVNYLANFHLLSILSPALRAQPPDRDVRVILTTCTSYLGGRLAELKDSKTPCPAGAAYPTSKLALMTFAQAFQKHLATYIRPDKAPNNARVILVDPGTCRTPGTRRWLSLGSLWGLAVYLLLWPVWWLLLKSAESGAESILTAAQDPSYSAGLVSSDALDTESKMAVSPGTTSVAPLLPGANSIKMLRECKEVPIGRAEVFDDEVAKELWAFSERQITALEKESALRRATEKKVAEAKIKQAKAAEADAQHGKVIGEVVDEPAAASSGAETRKPGSRRSRK